MDATNVEGSVRRARAAPRASVRSRLGYAFAAAGAVALAAAGAGLHALDAVGGRLETIRERVPHALAAGRAARSAERVVAAAPALLAASDPDRLEEVAAVVRAELERLGTDARALGDARGGRGSRGADAGSRAAALGRNLAALESLVARRLAAGERIGASRRELFAVDAAIERLLGPWLAITRGETGALVASASRDLERVALAATLERQEAVRETRDRAAAAVRLLAEGATAEDAARLPVLAFQVERAFADLDASAARLDPRLRAPLDARVAELRALARGPGSIPATRASELDLAAQATAALARADASSAALVEAVSGLGTAAVRDVDESVERAVAVRRAGAVVLLALVLPALLGALWLVWREVHRRVAAPLGAMAEAMHDIVAGRARAPVAVGGHGEIAAMGRAVETFRRHALEREALLAERARTAGRLEREVRERTAELETADAFKTRFLTAASHDLRQPLHALNLFVAQLRDAAGDAERRRLAGRVDAAVGTMNALFESLLDMSRLEAGVLEPELRPFRIGPLLERLEATLAPAARERGLALRVVPSDAAVTSDAALLERVLMNLAANAVRHTDGGAVLVGCRRRGGRLRIDVLDAGPGIAPERHALIFEEFRRLSPDGHGREAGLGLGLAIVARLAALLDCPVTLRSALGRGSRFSVSVPLARADAPVPRDARGALPFPDPLAGRLVAVIDDDEAVREATSGLLAGWGCETVAAACPRTALARLDALGRVPELLIVDCVLGDGDGGPGAVAALRRACGRDVPALLITGDTGARRSEEARAHGLALLHKPLSPMALRAASSRLLGAGLSPAPRPAPPPRRPPRCDCSPPAPSGSRSRGS